VEKVAKKRLILKAQKRIFGERAGNNPSILKGEGYDFVELREYQMGDDIRKIDWNITAKLHDPYVKVFQEEREINVVAVSILGGSTYFGSRVLKQETIAEVVALIGFSATKNMDQFSSFIFADREYHFERPSKRNGSVEKGVGDILDFNPINRSVNPQLIVETLLKKVKKRSLIFIISDFYTPLDLKYLAKKSEVIAVIVRDKIEENPPPFGYITLVDGESGERVEGDFSNNGSYKTNLKIHDSYIFENLKKWGVKTLKIENGGDTYSELRKFFGGR
jgi:uncharacterized protein (DUF58 family)